MSSLTTHSSTAPRIGPLGTFLKAVQHSKDRTKAFQKLDSNDRITIVGSKTIASKKTINWDAIGKKTLEGRVQSLMKEAAKKHTSTKSVAAKQLPHTQRVATKDKHETASTPSSTTAPKIQRLGTFLKAVQHSKDRTKAFQKLDSNDRITIVGSKTIASKKTINWDAIGKKTLEGRVQSLMKKATKTQPSTKPVTAKQSPKVEKAPTKVKSESSAISVATMISRLGRLKDFYTPLAFNKSLYELNQIGKREDGIKKMMKSHLENKGRMMSNSKECDKAFQKLDPKDAATVVKSTKLESLMAKKKTMDWKVIGKNTDDALEERMDVTFNTATSISALISPMCESIQARHLSILSRVATKDKGKISATSSTTTASRIKQVLEFIEITDIDKKDPANSKNTPKKGKDFAKAFQKLDVRDRTMIVEISKVSNKKSIDWDLFGKKSGEGYGYRLFLRSVVECQLGYLENQ